MEHEAQMQGGAIEEMHKRRITLDDGRYLIFYTFDGDLSPAPQSAGEQSAASSSQVEPQAEPSAEEERSV